MHLVAIAWGYVVLMMAVAEATSVNGSLLGAVFTVLLYGVLPLSIVLYVLGTPGRRRARRAAESVGVDSATAVDPDGRDHSAGDAVATVRKEP